MTGLVICQYVTVSCKLSFVVCWCHGWPATIPYIQHKRCKPTDNHLTTTAHECQRQRQTGGQKGSSIQDQMLRLPGYLLWWLWLAETSPREIGIFRNFFFIIMNSETLFFSILAERLHYQIFFDSTTQRHFCSLAKLKTEANLKIPYYFSFSYKSKFNLTRAFL